MVYIPIKASPLYDIFKNKYVFVFRGLIINFLLLEQIEIRRKRRQKRAKEEKRREKRIAEEENRLLGKYPIPNLHIESQAQFPCFETRKSESDGSSSELATPSSSLTTDLEYAGPSFATVI